MTHHHPASGNSPAKSERFQGGTTRRQVIGAIPVTLIAGTCQAAGSESADLAEPVVMTPGQRFRFHLESLQEICRELFPEDEVFVTIRSRLPRGA